MNAVMTPVVRSYLVTCHLSGLDDVLERIGLLEKVPEAERQAKWFARLKYKLGQMRILNKIPNSKMTAIASGNIGLGQVLRELNLSSVVIETTLEGLDQLQFPALKPRLDALGLTEKIPSPEMEELRQGKFASPVLTRLKLGQFVLEGAIAQLENQDGTRTKRMIRAESERSPFKLGSFPLVRCWDAAKPGWRVVHANENVNLLCFNQEMPTQEVTDYCKSNHLTLGNIKYLLALAAEHPYLLSTEPTVGEKGVNSDAPMDYGRPIVALGDEFNGIVPTFSRSSVGCVLSEGHPYGKGWPAKASFVTIPQHE